jgi:hypothetical protein
VSAYRSLEPVLLQRVSELRRQREHDAVLSRMARRIAARRIGRSLAGFAGTMMGGVAFLVAVASFLSSPESRSDRIAATVLLLAAWPLAILVGGTSRLVARGLLSLGARIPLTGHPSTDLARLEARDPLREAREAAMAWERASVALPLAALSLLAPLTIHFVVYTMLKGSGGGGAATLDDFGSWVALSALLVGHAHAALLIGSVIWARRLRARPTAELGQGVNQAWGKVLLVSIGCACLPGIVLIGIPPVLVAVTGLLFVPVMFVVTVRILAAERWTLEAS